jgi:hypothetical protein
MSDAKLDPPQKGHTRRLLRTTHIPTTHGHLVERVHVLAAPGITAPHRNVHNLSNGPLPDLDPVLSDFGKRLESYKEFNDPLASLVGHTETIKGVKFEVLDAKIQVAGPVFFIELLGWNETHGDLTIYRHLKRRMEHPNQARAADEALSAIRSAVSESADHAAVAAAAVAAAPPARPASVPGSVGDSATS